MKLSGLLLSISMLLSAASSFGGNITYEADPYTIYPTPTYPNLDLNSISKVKLTSNGESSPLETQLLRVEFDFPNANKIIATNFKKIGDTYRSVVKNAWIYKEIIVDITPRSVFRSHGEFTANIYVREQSSNLNDMNNAPGIQIYEYNGLMMDKTYNKTADSTSVIIDGKRAYIKLHQRWAINERGSRQGFLISVNWLGHGEFDRIIPGGTHSDTAIAFLTETITGGGEERVVYSIRYKDSLGNIHETGPDLLDSLFGI
ncbi:MAG: hypothetical protein JKY50_18115 [Oleispira sp.]|nr:hypothetical protein [Oleispira sp.]MBL4880827.1 hypothetical protein [Oleispira sp.]